MAEERISLVIELDAKRAAQVVRALGGDVTALRRDGAAAGPALAGELRQAKGAYDWEPAAYVPGLPEHAIEGVEAPLWTETVATRADLEFLAFPRLAGVAEIGWTPAARRAWDDYRRRLGAQAPRWTALGLNF
ncbi:MAG: family 20 glycosylhydrolase [Rubricoccaceae bacterium]